MDDNEDGKDKDGDEEKDDSDDDNDSEKNDKEDTNDNKDKDDNNNNDNNDSEDDDEDDEDNEDDGDNDDDDDDNNNEEDDKEDNNDNGLGPDEDLQCLRTPLSIVRRLIVMLGPDFRVSYTTAARPDHRYFTTLSNCIGLFVFIQGFCLVNVPSVATLTILHHYCLLEGFRLAI